MFYAHSLPDVAEENWQPLQAHCSGVADLARDFSAHVGLEKAAYLAGQLHDLGKYTAGFQNYIQGKGPSIEHSIAGAALLYGRLAESPKLSREDCFMARLIAYCVAGHHAGLPDWVNEERSSLESRLKTIASAPEGPWQSELHPDFTGLLPDFFRNNPPGKENFAFAFSVMGRMLYSCLTDADFRDTEAFYARAEGRTIDRAWPALEFLLPEYIRRFDAYMAALPAADTPLNRLRRDILHHVREKAAMPPGFFTLTVPTGGGKTLTSLAFALDHARAHGLRRIIYAIPFTSIIEQTAAVFREVLGDKNILEHHSAIEDPRFDGNSSHRLSPKVLQAIKMRQAREDWAAPIVVTTNVQLFESLFAARSSRTRKLHNIAGAVIILDEAQTIPRPLLLPVMRMLEELCTRYHCTIVLCTATQPALDKEKLEGGLPLAGRELAPDPVGLAQKLKRAKIRPVGEKSNADLVTALAEEPQALVIVNSRKHALELYRAAQAEELEDVIHLTTRMCAAHRMNVLKDVRGRLKSDAPCRVIATSLIEAGVDVDFPSVWRAESGLDSLVQAAGRCNREGKRRLEDSIVKVFSCPDYPPPPEIRSLIGDMGRMADSFADDLGAPAAIEAYFSEVYWRLDKAGLDARKILDKFSICSAGPSFAYRTVAEDFRMIGEGMDPVIIPFDDKAREAIGQLTIENISSGRLARALQRYIVQVPPKARTALLANGRAAFAEPDLRADQFCVLSDESLYLPDIGLMWENADYLSAEQTLW